jgi:hypothetical protein
LEIKILNKASLLLMCSIIAACGGGGSDDEGNTGNNGSSSYTAPLTTTSWTAQQIKTQVLAGYDSGAVVRWESPIEVSTNGIPRVEEALDRYEKLLGGIVFFDRVSHTPENGIVFVEGGARNGDNTPGCGNVNNSVDPSPTFQQITTQTPDNIIPSKYSGLYYIHLGSTECDDEKNSIDHGPYASAIAEHELGHALGVHSHFDGFEGEEGLIQPEFFNVIYNLYANPIGASENEVSISIVEVGQFGE